MTTREVPPLIAAIAAKVNMTPIAWRIDTTSVTIVFEQGPKMTFERDQVPDQVPEAIEPVIQEVAPPATMEEAYQFIKTHKPLPKRKPRK